MTAYDFSGSVPLLMVDADNQQYASILKALAVINRFHLRESYTVQKTSEIKCGTGKHTDGLDVGVRKPGVQQPLDRARKGREFPEEGGYGRLRSCAILSHIDSL